MSTTAITCTNCRDLEEALDYPLSVGRVVYPAEPEYPEGVALWNSRNKREPSALVQVQGVEDVRTVVRYARERGLPFSVRAGGHEVDGWSLKDTWDPENILRFNKNIHPSGWSEG